MRKITSVFIFLLVILLSSCTSSSQKEKLSISKYNDSTGKNYEETDNGYKAAFYDKNEITIEKIKKWIELCEIEDGYHEYVYSDPDSWDMFIYYPTNNGIYCSPSLKFSVVDQIVKVYITNNSSTNRINSNYILVRIQAPSIGAWPIKSELSIDNKRIEMQDHQYS